MIGFYLGTSKPYGHFDLRFHFNFPWKYTRKVYPELYTQDIYLMKFRLTICQR